MASLIHHHAGIVREPLPTKDFAEYPKMMSHPAFQPGTPALEVKHPGGKVEYVGGTSIRFPPVLVHDADNEEYYASKGYASQGKSDPAAFARLAAMAQPAMVGYVPQRYPMWAGGVLVNDEDEEAAALGARRDQMMLPHPEDDASVTAPPPPVDDGSDQTAEIIAQKDAVIELQAEQMLAMNARMDAQAAQLAEMMALMQAMTAAKGIDTSDTLSPDDKPMSRQAKAYQTRRANAAAKAVAEQAAQPDPGDAEA